MTKRFIGESILLTAMITVFSGSMVFAESGETAETESIESTADAETQSVVSGESEAIDYLGKELEESSNHLLRTGEDMDDLYSELTWTSVADTFPEKFDLRERGTVTPVKSQRPWGTCWSFATIAASETSILESFGLTTKSYRERFGEDLDLSEKHLAWFTTKALPDVSEYPHGEYPYDESQAGEGLHFMEEGDQEPFNMGGNYYLSTTSLSDGIGILKEKYAPYCNSEGNAEKAGDWSLPEDQRYSVSFELEGVNLLPSPATWDDHYRPEGTEAIKSELLAGRAVGVCFCADQSMPEMSKEEMREKLKNDLKDNTRASEEEKAYYIDVRSGFIDTDNLGEEELKNKVAKDLFFDFDTTQIIGRVDFCVSIPADPLGLNEPESLLWAEAKKGTSHDIYESFIQLILTLGKERPQDTILPPSFLGAFDAEKIAFLPYSSILEVLRQNDFNWNVAPSDHSTKEF